MQSLINIMQKHYLNAYIITCPNSQILKGKIKVFLKFNNDRTLRSQGGLNAFQLENTTHRKNHIQKINFENAFMIYFISFDMTSNHLTSHR